MPNETSNSPKGRTGKPAGTWPFGTRAQQGERVRRIGVLVSGAEDDPEMQARLVGFRQRLARFGWSEGRSLSLRNGQR
jgi:putative ABC transport system substrate-binding protein